MVNNAYRVADTNRILGHSQFAQPVMLARDDDDYTKLDIEALVASGDCFITIATSLDDSTKHLAADESDALPQIEKAVSVLLYLQRHYQIVRKRPD